MDYQKQSQIGGPQWNYQKGVYPEIGVESILYWQRDTELLRGSPQP